MLSEAFGSVRSFSEIWEFFVRFSEKVLSISSAILFAIGITIDIAIGFIFLIFFTLGGGNPPREKKSRKIKPMAMSMVMPMAKRIALLTISTSP